MYCWIIFLPAVIKFRVQFLGINTNMKLQVKEEVLTLFVFTRVSSYLWLSWWDANCKMGSWRTRAKFCLNHLYNWRQTTSKTKTNTPNKKTMFCCVCQWLIDNWKDRVWLCGYIHNSMVKVRGCLPRLQPRTDWRTRGFLGTPASDPGCWSVCCRHLGSESLSPASQCPRPAHKACLISR